MGDVVREMYHRPVALWKRLLGIVCCVVGLPVLDAAATFTSDDRHERWASRMFDTLERAGLLPPEVPETADHSVLSDREQDACDCAGCTGYPLEQGEFHDDCESDCESCVQEAGRPPLTTTTHAWMISNGMQGERGFTLYVATLSDGAEIRSMDKVGVYPEWPALIQALAELNPPKA